MGVNNMCIHLTSSFAAPSGFTIKEPLLELSLIFLRSVLIVKVV